VYAAGRTSGTTLSGASFEFVYSGGSAIGTIVSSGGREIVSGTGVGTGTVVHDGGYAIVSGGGTLVRTVVNSGGSEWVDAGGSANLTVLGSGGTETVQAGGSASATTVNNSGTEWVQAGGSASATTVNGGGTQDVNDGTATATTVSSGGVLEVSLVAVVNGAHLAKGSVVDFSDVAFDPSGTASVDPTTHLLTLSAGGVSQSIGVDPAQSFGGAAFSRADDGHGGTDVTAPCFRAGTLIRTDRGEVPVEALRVGDRVASAFGGVVRVSWLGHRHIDCKRHPRPHDVWPVRVAAGAFGADRPCRELWLSPDHAVFIDGVLIPVRYLLNDATIRQDSVGQVSYWHVELPLHDVLFAEGMAVESYLDTGNRGAFANGGGGTMLHADFARRVWEAESCAPLVHDGAELAAVRGALHERAEALGYAITREADLRFVVDGSAVRSHVEGRTHHFHLPGAASAGRLLSRSAVPAFVGADSDDHRRLGVAVSRIVLDGRAIGLDDPRLGAGWQVDAPDAAGGHWRWTNGDAALEVAGVRLLEVEVAITARYWLADGRAGALAA
jgi:autotransporter passenger strand-loop-strand repeat protein